MAGVLLIKGERRPTPQSNGDLDTLLLPFAPAKGNDYAEVMLLQQIPYACFDDQKPPQIQKDSQGRFICNDGQTGVVEDFNGQFGGPKVWIDSGRYTLINGEARLEPRLQSGRVYRWRLVHSGVINSIALRIKKINDPTQIRLLAVSSQDRADEVKGLCTGTDVTQFEVAADGLTRGQVFGKTTNYLQPGYRSDVLFVLPETGKYCVYDDQVPAEVAVTGPPMGKPTPKSQAAEAENANVLAIITATGGEPVKDQEDFLTKQLLAAADKLPVDVKDQVKADLGNGLRLSKFVPHANVTDEEVAKSDLPVVPIDFGFNDEFTTGEVNDKAYDPARIDQTLILGTAQSWRLSSAQLSHPFHIHVNPFQIVSVKDKNTGEDKTTDKQSEYWGMKGVWKDTLFVEGDPCNPTCAPPKGVDIEVRTRYARYIGQFVMHCHILPHEDTGMMQNVEVVLPGTEPYRPCATACDPTLPSGGH